MSKLEVDAIEPQSGTTLTIGASGDNVGIGTTNPAYNLDVVGQTGSLARLRIQNNGTLATDSSVLQIGIAGTTAESLIYFASPSDANVGQIRYDHASNYLSITTNASEAMRIDSSGNVGIGTTSPDENLHIFAGSAGSVTANTASQLVIENSLDAGINILSPNTKDNWLMFGDVDDNFVGGLKYNHPSDYLALYANNAEHMRINSSGNVGIGTSVDPASRLAVVDVKNGSEASPHFTITGSGYTGYHWIDSTAYYIGQNSNSRSLRIYSGSNEAVGAQLGAGGTSFGTYSDERLKKDITDLTNGLNKILALRPVNFKYKSDADDYRNRIGIIAQSIVGQVDEALDQTKITADDETQYYNVRYQDLIPVLVKGMQEQQTKIQELEARITALENN